MDVLVPKMYMEYGKYVNSYRSFPLNIDGLKPVERRVLLSAYQIAREKLVKSVRVDGHCVGHFHPHGGCYGTISQLVRQGFLDGQGNFGTNLGIEALGPAAPRYTECKMSKETVELAFKYIKYVPWVESELDNEPEYLPTMFPFCLIGQEYTQGIGFGYKTFIPCYKVEDLRERLLYLLKIKKDRPIIKPITNCKILSKNDELDTLLTTGKLSMRVQGVIEVNNTASKAILKSWPPGRRFESYLNKFSKELENGDIGYIDSSNERVGTKIEFDVLKQRNRVAIFSKFIAKLKEVVKGNISFETIVVDRHNNVKATSIDELLLNTYNYYTSVNETMLQQEINRYNELINEYNTLAKIRKPLADALSWGRFDKEHMEEIITGVSEVSEVKPEIVKMLISKYKIQKLITLNIDTKEITDKVQELQADFNNIQNYVLNQYGEVKNV